MARKSGDMDETLAVYQGTREVGPEGKGRYACFDELLEKACIATARKCSPS